MQESIEYYASLLYEAGWNIMPLAGKRPIGEWGRLQRERGNPENISAYLTRHPEANVGILCGEISGVSVIDIDVGDGYDPDAVSRFLEKYPTPIAVQTGGGGLHLYYQYTKVKNAVRVKIPGIPMDIRSQGGYVVAPPSIHPETKQAYRFVNTDDLSQEIDFEMVITLREQLPPFPEEVKVQCAGDIAKTPDDWRAIVYNTNEGSRNFNAAALIGKLINGMSPADWYSVAWPLIVAWNEVHVKPSMNKKELERTFESITKSALRAKQWGDESNMQPVVPQINPEEHR